MFFSFRNPLSMKKRWRKAKLPGFHVFSWKILLKVRTGLAQAKQCPFF